MTDILERDFIKDFCSLCESGFRQGWHEMNGGNLSYRLKNEETEHIKDFFILTDNWIDIGISVPDLGREFFLVTGTGKYFKNVSGNPEKNTGIIEIDEKGEKYRIVWGLSDNSRPTSELPTHLMNHEVKKKQTSGKHRIIYHCHTPNIIALTFLLPLKDEIFTRELWETMTECPIIFNKGIGVTKWMVPGGKEIAVETSKLMEMYDIVIWAHHGLFCSGENFDISFGLALTLEKAAEILIKILSVSPKRLQTISTDNFRKLAEDFNVHLPEKFLYENEKYNLK
ncbi:MAG: rhamnulose-1-phosphate aldolase [Leptotrichiaceae bacterium]|nr:rhamnulose-1-phosphate aldolase [Leptotrichiaceae bacterium]